MNIVSRALLIGAFAMLVPTAAYADDVWHPETLHPDPAHPTHPTHPDPVHPGHDPHSAPAPIAGAGLGALMLLGASYRGLRRKRPAD